ncbi:MAG TPA: XamI family restriction endonuclease, partial [Thermomicrobiales bacterium]|nr:XamI family restriction endonuclease [Thermomicrobiales bacterium]
KAAVIASAALLATQKVATRRRNEGKEKQERQVRDALKGIGFEEVEIPRRIIPNIAAAPPPGCFSREVTFGERKADLVVGLWDRRIMAIECKVSNSSINSVKRLNNDAAIKAEIWRRDFGALNVIPAAVLSGVYKLHNLQQAQNQHLTLYWAHRLSDLTDWIARTRWQEPD